MLNFIEVSFFGNKQLNAAERQVYDQLKKDPTNQPLHDLLTAILLEQKSSDQEALEYYKKKELKKNPFAIIGRERIIIKNTSVSDFITESLRRLSIQLLDFFLGKPKRYLQNSLVNTAKGVGFLSTPRVLNITNSPILIEDRDNKNQVEKEEIKEEPTEELEFKVDNALLPLYESGDYTPSAPLLSDFLEDPEKKDRDFVAVP